jgi:hypothetical protein
MLPPSTAVDTGAAGVGVGTVVGVPPVGPDVAGAAVGVLLLLEQAVAIRAATASNEPKRFISTTFLGNRQRGTGRNRTRGAMSSSELAAKVPP